MIYLVIIAAAVALLAFAFGLLGNVPPTPDWLLGTSTAIIDVMQQGILIMSYLVGAHLFFGTIIILAAVFAYEPVHHLVMWVLRKIPVLGIN